LLYGSLRELRRDTAITAIINRWEHAAGHFAGNWLNISVAWIPNRSCVTIGYRGREVVEGKEVFTGMPGRFQGDLYIFDKIIRRNIEVPL